jgi:hypothetical protein
MSNYNISHSAAATAARAIMENKIESGRASAMNLFERVINDSPHDMVAPGQRLAERLKTLVNDAF